MKTALYWAYGSGSSEGVSILAPPRAGTCGRLLSNVGSGSSDLQSRLLKGTGSLSIETGNSVEFVLEYGIDIVGLLDLSTTGTLFALSITFLESKKESTPSKRILLSTEAEEALGGLDDLGSCDGRRGITCFPG